MTPVLPAFVYLQFLALAGLVLRRQSPLSMGYRWLHVLAGVLGLGAGWLSFLFCFEVAKTKGFEAPVLEDMERMLDQCLGGVLLASAACMGGLKIALRGPWPDSPKSAKTGTEA